LAHLRSTQPTSHLQAYSAAGAGSDPDSGERARRGQLRRIQPHATVLARSAARHTALDSIIGYKVYGKALLGVDEVVTRMSLPAQASGEIHSSRAAFPTGTTPFPLR
jgi:hypothetical protein